MLWLLTSSPINLWTKLLTKAIVACGTWEFGHLPRYGQDPDQSTGPLFWAEFSLFLLSVVAVPAWALLTTGLLGVAPALARRNAASIGLCLLGVGAFVGLRLWFPSLIEWVAD